MNKDEAEVRRLPSVGGFYWARQTAYEWYNLIVYVMGDPPFMRLRAWHYIDGESHEIEVYNIAEFGPRIEESKPDRSWRQFAKELDAAHKD